jgi:tellurite resistance protein
MTKTTPLDSLVHIMVVMSAADRAMTDAELGKIGNIAQTLPVFEGYSADNLMHAAAVCREILQADDGLQQVLEAASEALPKKLRETAYALAVEIAAADLRLEREELRILQLIRDALKLDKLVCAAIERSARARFQVL